MLGPSEPAEAADEPDFDAIRNSPKNDLAGTREGGKSRSRPLRQRQDRGTDTVTSRDRCGQDDASLTRILQGARRIAVIGASPRSDRHSYRVMQYMQANGHRILPVNPNAAGTEILGEPVYESLDAVPAPIDLVDVFRQPDAIPSTVDDILRLAKAKQIRTVWLQLGLSNDDAAAKVRAAGLDIVMDRCLKIEFGRLLSHG